MEKREWWKEAVVYQVYPKSFQDSNNDGIGDLRGIIQRLDYIRDLGANVIWLSPVYCSPMCDNGYDISNYYHINSLFGSDEDMDELIDEAKKRGISILMDLVVNHTSDEHEWFKKALADPYGKYGKYYIFREGKNGEAPNNWRSYFGSSAWERVGDSDLYYLHAFAKKQPDLNWENPELREEIYRMVNYWLDKGIAGFRVDAICNLKKNITCGRLPADGEDGLCDIRHGILNQPGLDQFLRELKERTFQIHNSMTVAEAVIPYEFLGEFIGEDGFFSMVFDFSYTDIDIPPSGEWFPREKWTVKDLRDKIFHSQEMLQKTGWGAPYLENHDQPRSINKYIPEKEISYYSKTMLAGLFLMLKGTPFIYQGQEIGMENIRMDRIEEYDDVSTFTPYERAIASGMSKEEAMEVVFVRSRDNARTPMQWDDTKNAGFSQHDTTWLKINPNYREINTKNNKVLEFYKRLISLRRNSEYRETVIYGEFVPVRNIDEPVIAYERVSGENKLMTICNFQNAPAEVQIKEGYKEVVISNYENRLFKTGWITLKPYECVILSGV